MSVVQALGSGAVGAIVLNLIHETARRVHPDAPHVHEVGMRAIARSMQELGKTPPGEEELFRWTMAGDLVSNALYYSLIGTGDPDHLWRRGAALGFAAGVGAVALPGPLGLGSEPVTRTPATGVMTVAWYTLGGIAAAAALQAWRRQG